MKQIRNFITSLPEQITAPKLDFALSILVALLGGVIFGMLISPRKYMHIGCNNGSGNHTATDRLEEEE